MAEHGDKRQPTPPRSPSLIERAAGRLAAPPAPQPRQQEPHRPEPHRVEPRLEPAAAAVEAEPQPVQAQVQAQAKAVIDFERLKRGGMVVPHGLPTVIADEFRLIKRPLLLRAFAPEPAGERRNNLIMVTSSVPGEGKTFTAINLAMSMAAERDVHVVLADADLGRPTLARTLGIAPGRGLAELLEDETLDVGDVLLRTNLPNLAVIPGGRAHPMGTELLASRRAGRLIGEMAARYSDRVLIFDTAPVLSSAEGSSLARFIGQVVVVVEAERTSAPELRNALEVLGERDGIQLVLNKTRTRFGAGQLGSYFGGRGMG